MKSEVRRIAKKADLPSAEKKDSQGICFVGKVDLPVFLQQKLKPKEGDVVEVFDEFYRNNEQYLLIQDILNSLLIDGYEGSAQMITDYISDDLPGNSLKINDFHEKTVMGNPANEGGCSKNSEFDKVKIAALSDEVLFKISQPVKYDGIHFETETYRSGNHHLKKTRYKENPFAKIVGKHDGAHFYTIGQRKGLNIGGHKDSLFVIETDIPSNMIYVGEGHTHKGLSRSCLRLSPEDIHWIREDLRMNIGEIRRFRVRIRYRQPLQDATLIQRENGLFVLFDEPQRGITPGQFAVWYDNDEMLGSAVI